MCWDILAKARLRINHVLFPAAVTQVTTFPCKWGLSALAGKGRVCGWRLALGLLWEREALAPLPVTNTLRALSLLLPSLGLWRARAWHLSPVKVLSDPLLPPLSHVSQGLPRRLECGNSCCYSLPGTWPEALLATLFI